MKKILFLAGFLWSMQSVFAQSQDIDSFLQKIAVEKNDNRRIDLINEFLANTAETNPVLDMQNAQKILLYAQKNEDKITEAMALSELGYDYRAFGNRTKSLDYGLKATALAAETGNIKLRANTELNVAHNYKDQADYSKAISMYMSIAGYATSIKDNLILLWTFNSIGQVYLEMNKLDSALKYCQRAFELLRNDTTFLCSILKHLGSIQGKMGNLPVAAGYFDMALKEAYRINSPRWINEVCMAMAQYYYDNKQIDSSLVYAKQAIAAVKNTAFSNKSIKPAKLLLDIYENGNNDSAIKYFKVYKSANDSLFSAQTIQQTRLLTFEDELRQQQVAESKLKTEEERKRNIQYALIALGIITFIIFFLLLSRRHITNTRLIKFLSVVALLLVFEFLNLLLHPFLERITNHSPLLMLLALAFMAALLVPMHHKLEKWALTRLVEKNKQVRLAAAKRTIEKLERKTENL